MGTVKSFNVRVYGILVEGTKVLVTDEFRNGLFITKFPGGGLHWGESTIKALERECFEEMGQEVNVTDHFYTTDFFVPSAFDKNQQMMSIYYLMELIDDLEFPISEKKNDFKKLNDGAQIYRWLELDKLSDVEFTFPIDKKVGQLLKKKLVLKK